VCRVAWGLSMVSGSLSSRVPVLTRGFCFGVRRSVMIRSHCPTVHPPPGTVVFGGVEEARQAHVEMLAASLASTSRASSSAPSPWILIAKWWRTKSMPHRWTISWRRERYGFTARESQRIHRCFTELLAARRGVVVCSSETACRVCTGAGIVGCMVIWAQFNLPGSSGSEEWTCSTRASKPASSLGAFACG